MKVDNLPEDSTKWGVPEVKQWLRQGFSVWGRSSERPPFFPLNGYFTEQDTPEQQLTQLCGPHPEFRQLVLQATKGLFGDLPPDISGYRLFNYLQRLIIAVHEPDLLGDMWQRLASPDFLTPAVPDIRRELFAQAFICVEELASSATAFELLTRTMIASRHFDPAWAPSALYSMLHHDPSKLAVHLAQLAPYVDDLDDERKVSGIIEGCIKVIYEVLPKSDPQRVLEGIISDELRYRADNKGNVTAQVAGDVLNNWVIEFSNEEAASASSRTVQVILKPEKKHEIGATIVAHVAKDDSSTWSQVEKTIRWQQVDQSTNSGQPSFEDELEFAA